MPKITCVSDAMRVIRDILVRPVSELSLSRGNSGFEIDRTSVNTYMESVRRKPVSDPYTALSETLNFASNARIWENHEFRFSKQLLSITHDLLMSKSSPVSTRMDMNGKHVVLTNPDIDEAVRHVLRGAHVTVACLDQFRFSTDMHVRQALESPASVVQSMLYSRELIASADAVFNRTSETHVPDILAGLRLLRPFLDTRRMFELDEQKLETLNFLDPKSASATESAIHEAMEVITGLDGACLQAASLDLLLTARSPLPEFVVKHACLAGLSPLDRPDKNRLIIVGQHEHESVRRFSRTAETVLGFTVRRIGEMDPGALRDVVVGDLHSCSDRRVEQRVISSFDSDPFVLASQHLVSSSTPAKIHSLEFKTLSCKKPANDEAQI